MNEPAPLQKAVADAIMGLALEVLRTGKPSSLTDAVDQVIMAQKSIASYVMEELP